MKNTFKILATNWINLLGVFIIVFIFSIFFVYLKHKSFNILQAILSASISICLYGIIFWIGFVLELIVLDLLFIVFSRKHLKIMMFLEWLIISIPFVYSTIKYKQWIFLVAIIAFFITQMMRKKLIEKINN